VETALAPSQTPEPQASVKPKAGELIEIAKPGATLSAKAKEKIQLNSTTHQMPTTTEYVLKSKTIS
jgi:hypothetical protein